MKISAIKSLALGKSLNWSKVHLIYFVLAGFDLLAVLMGLWLSESTKLSYQDAARDYNISDVLYDDARHLRNAAVAINAPANQLFRGIDLAEARSDLKAAKSEFEKALTSDTVSLSRNADTVAGTQQDGVLPASLADAYPDRFAALQKVKSRLGVLLIAMTSETTTAINSLGMHDDRAAAAHVEKSVDAFGNMLAAINAWDDIAASISDAARSRAEQSMIFSTRVQYAIGLFIFAMVSLVSLYGLFVGKLLKNKFIDLETSHTEIATFNMQLQTMNDDVTRLNGTLAANVEELRAAQDEIIRKGKMAQLGQLTATIAHEIRNPLGAARTSTYLLERKIKGKGMGVEPQIDRINTAITRCDNIITQLLDFSRARVAQCQDVALDDWLTTIVQEEARGLPAQIAMTLELSAGDHKVRFDPDRMQRVVVNLVQNAAEAMTVKGRDGTATNTADPKIIVRCAVEDGEAVITVEDNGPGIAPELLKKILDPLFTTKSFGTGLGLPAVENIMHQHGGKLEVQSYSGHGAIFTARWPSDGPKADGESVAA
jgi:signal transduction histidine kinase